MTTLITMKVGSARARICGARCYHAKGDDCQCICGGRNHGKGFKEAHRTTAHEVVTATTSKVIRTLAAIECVVTPVADQDV